MAERHVLRQQVRSSPTGRGQRSKDQHPPTVGPRARWTLAGTIFQVGSPRANLAHGIATRFSGRTGEVERLKGLEPSTFSLGSGMPPPGMRGHWRTMGDMSGHSVRPLTGHRGHERTWWA